jgi:hypothetical protein
MGTILQEMRHGRLHKVAIYCPLTLTDRFNVIDKIKAHGGVAESKMDQAEVLLAQDGNGMEWYRSVLPRKRRPDAHVVDRKWLDDSVAAGVMQNRTSYYPRYLDVVPREPATTSRVRTNERQ